MRRATSEQIGTAQAVLAELASDLQARLTRARAAGRLSAAASTAVELADVLSVAASLGGWHEQGERLEPDGRGSAGAVGEPAIRVVEWTSPRALGPVDHDVADVPELREVGQPVERSADASQYLAELDLLRREVQAAAPERERWRLNGARLNVWGERGPAANKTLADAIGEHGWDAVRELFRWALLEVVAGRRAPKLHAASLQPGGFGALLDAYGRAQAAERERLEIEERRAAEARPASPAMDYEALAAASAEATRRLKEGA